MAILVTGGAGYIGSHVVRQLSEAGQEVIVYDNLSTGFAEALIYNEKIIQADLADQLTLEKIFQQYKIDTVLHFAAFVSVTESIANPLKYYANNTINTLNLLQACVKYDVKNFIFSSTAAVYSASPSGIVSETTPAEPSNPYGVSKLFSEKILCDTAKAHNLNYVILRYFNVAGADPKARIGQRYPNATHLIKMCSQAAFGQRKAVEIYGTDYLTPDGTGVRDYIHVEDLASSHLAAMDYLLANNPSITLNVGYGKGASVREVINTFKKISGADFPVLEIARRPGDLAKVIAEAQLIREKLNWQPRYDSLETIIADVWRWENKMQKMI